MDENLAVLCVEDHDRHHRPSAYQPAVNHLELTPDEIRECKRSWEAFVSETHKPFPKVIATLSAYGNDAFIHSVRLVMQWSDRIEYQRSYHLLDGNLDKMTQLEHFLCMAKARARQIPRFEAMTCPDTARRLVESRASGRYESGSVNQMGRGIPRTKDKIRGHSGVFRD